MWRWGKPRTLLCRLARPGMSGLRFLRKRHPHQGPTRQGLRLAGIYRLDAGYVQPRHGFADVLIVPRRSRRGRLIDVLFPPLVHGDVDREHHLGMRLGVRGRRGRRGLRFLGRRKGSPFRAAARSPGRALGDGLRRRRGGRHGLRLLGRRVGLGHGRRRRGRVQGRRDRRLFAPLEQAGERGLGRHRLPRRPLPHGRQILGSLQRDVGSLRRLRGGGEARPTASDSTPPSHLRRWGRQPELGGRLRRRAGGLPRIRTLLFRDLLLGGHHPAPIHLLEPGHALRFDLFGVSRGELGKRGLDRYIARGDFEDPLVDRNRLDELSAFVVGLGDCLIVLHRLFALAQVLESAGELQTRHQIVAVLLDDGALLFDELFELALGEASLVRHYELRPY